MIILASQSPRRRQILADILGDIPFETMPSDFDERQIREKSLSKLCLKEATGKALAIAVRHPDDIVIASDTMVEFNHRQIGKPKDRQDAKKTLQMLSGNTHHILTAYAIYQGEKCLVSRVIHATLYIEKMADLEIEEYLDTGSPFDKAGSYGIQDTDFINSRILEGDKETIMGLPKADLEADLHDLGIIG
jgi:septum formation protein